MARTRAMLAAGMCAVGLLAPGVLAQKSIVTGQPNPNQPLRRVPAQPASPVDSNLDARAAIEAARKKAAQIKGRVLVVWSADPMAEMTLATLDTLRSYDNGRIIKVEYEVVWVPIGKGTHAEANRELANALGAGVSATDTHPTLTVLDTAGKHIASRNVVEMMDELRKRSVGVLKVQDFLSEHKAPPPDVRAMIDEAVAAAKPGSRCVLLVFGNHEDVWSGRLRSWLAQPEVAGALAKSTVVLNVELTRDKDAAKVMEELGGKNVMTLPWFVVLGPGGQPVGASQSEKIPNIGFPTDDGEIGVFLDLIRKGYPAFSEADAKAIRDSLVAYRGRKPR